MIRALAIVLVAALLGCATGPAPRWDGELEGMQALPPGRACDVVEGAPACQTGVSYPEALGLYLPTCCVECRKRLAARGEAGVPWDVVLWLAGGALAAGAVAGGVAVGVAK